LQLAFRINRRRLSFWCCDDITEPSMNAIQYSEVPMPTRKWVFGFEELDQVKDHVGDDWDAVRGLLGGKGANLADMVRIGLPVPHGFHRIHRGLQYLSRFGRHLSRRYVGPGHGAPSKRLRPKRENASAAQKTPAGLLPVRRQVFHARDDGYGTQHRPQPPDRDRHDPTDRRPPLCIRFAYRRLIQMFGSVVMGIDDEPFEAVITDARLAAGVENDPELSAEDWQSGGGTIQGHLPSSHHP
jgi:pyruvate,orthophosphate dikinase